MATSPKGTLTNLSYIFGYDHDTNAATADKDGSKIRTRTDSAPGLEQTYAYDSAGRMTLAKETAGTTLKTTWVYCFDAAGNLTSQADTGTCPGSGSTCTYNDASQPTAKNGVTTGWSYDKLGNETAGASTTAEARTAEKWSDYSQAAAISRALGEEVAFVELSREAARAHMARFMPEEVVDGTLDVLGVLLPGEHAVGPDVENVLRRPARPFDEWVARNLPAFQ
ncbi:hypothetical protein [Streptomyces chryseus]|uniref:hypothetical protein n=1 Tax=Streptomyces chryseus TaxID=68186 RepID=UPI001E2CBFC7|nr:hypothetical protein [Streptomyces chryseus]